MQIPDVFTKNKIEIRDIQISLILDQYLEYLDRMQEMDLEVASEFVQMASHLMYIKTKMLLPRLNEDGQEITEEDPRSQLVEKILEYKRFKQISQMLSEYEEENSHIYEKPKEDISEQDQE